MYIYKFIVVHLRLLVSILVKRYKIYVFSIRNRCEISLDANFTGDLSRLNVGSSTVINGNANFRFKEGVISIGSNCLFANNVTLICNTYCVNGNQYVSSDRMYSKDIRIGDHVWVGSNVVILPGVDIGDNVIIGASSLVTKDVPSNEVWGGVPAKLLYKR